MFSRRPAFVVMIMALALSCQRVDLGPGPLEVRIECDESEGELFLWEGVGGYAQKAHFGEPHFFYISYAGESTGVNDERVISFEVAESQVRAYSDLTEAAIGKKMAVFVDGELLAAPIVHSRLPGVGLISYGQYGFTEKQAQELIATLLGPVD